MSSKELRDLIDQETEAAEAARGQEWDGPLPDHVKVSRPNQARSKVLQIRLNPEDFEALEAIATRRDLPVSTIAREQLLKLLAPDQSGATPGTMLAAVGELVSLATSIQETLASQPPGPFAVASAALRGAQDERHGVQQ